MSTRDDLYALNRNGPWCRVLADALVDGGVHNVVICSGGRSSMLALTLHHTESLVCLPHVDERSGGFVALGLAAATGLPTAICTTSGSAVANLLPALAEAAPRRLPLVLLTCDRAMTNRLPREPQCTPQAAICLPLLSDQLALSDPDDAPDALAGLRGAVLRLLHGQRGPVQINVPQIGTYCATEAEPGWRPHAAESASSGGRTQSPLRALDLAPLQDVVAAAAAIGARPGLRGLILAGPSTPTEAAVAARLADSTGFPLLADAASGLRHREAPALSTGEALVKSGSLGFQRTELLIRLGGAPASLMLQQAVASLACPILSIVAHDPGPDFLSRAAHGILPPTAGGLEWLAQRLSPGDPDWAARWSAAESAAARRRENFISRLPWGEVKAASIICNAAGFDLAHFGNSLSVRHASLVARSDGARRTVFVSRGVNGTDGSLGTFLGECLGTGGRGLALIGDQAAVHDLPALANPIWSSVRGAICIMNNHGGEIFDLAACGRIDGAEEVIRNPPAIDFQAAAAAFRLDHRLCSDPTTLVAALEKAAQGDRLLMVEVAVPPHTARRDFPRLSRTMAG